MEQCCPDNGLYFPCCPVTQYTAQINNSDGKGTLEKERKKIKDRKRKTEEKSSCRTKMLKTLLAVEFQLAFCKG
jgi:hypothetical protein